MAREGNKTRKTAYSNITPPNLQRQQQSRVQINSLTKSVSDATCIYCVDLSDKECLTTLEGMYDTMSDKSRLVFLRGIFLDYDTLLSGTEVPLAEICSISILAP